jgi:hypothetical protein
MMLRLLPCVDGTSVNQTVSLTWRARAAIAVKIRLTTDARALKQPRPALGTVGTACGSGTGQRRNPPVPTGLSNARLATALVAAGLTTTLALLALLHLRRQLSVQIKDLARRFDVAKEGILALVEKERLIAADRKALWRLHNGDWP